MKSKLKEKLNLKSESLIPKSPITELKDKPKSKQWKLHQKTQWYGEKSPQEMVQVQSSLMRTSAILFLYVCFQHTVNSFDLKEEK